MLRACCSRHTKRSHHPRVLLVLDIDLFRPEVASSVARDCCGSGQARWFATGQPNKLVDVWHLNSIVTSVKLLALVRWERQQWTTDLTNIYFRKTVIQLHTKYPYRVLRSLQAVSAIRFALVFAESKAPGSVLVHIFIFIPALLNLPRSLATAWDSKQGNYRFIMTRCVETTTKGSWIDDAK